MKLRNLFMAVIAGAAVLVGCNKEEDLGPAKLELETTEIKLDSKEATQEISFTATRDWFVSGLEDWIAISAEQGTASPSEQKVTISVNENADFIRSATLSFSIGFERAVLTITQDGPKGEYVMPITTIKDFIAKADTKEYYRLKGTVSSFRTGTSNSGNPYMQFTLTDDTGSITAYGFKEGQYDKWANVIQNGATVTLTGTYQLYTNSNTGAQTHEIMNITIEEYEGAGEPGEIEASTVADFIAAASATKYYRLTGVVANFKTGTNTSGKNWMQFDLKDETGSILVYGFKDGQYEEWADKIKDGGTVVLNGTYEYYEAKSQHEVMNATIECFTEGGDIPGDIASSTVADFIAAASGTTYYRLTGVVSEFKTGTNNSSGKNWMQFMLTDNTGSILVYGFKDGQYDEWSAKIKDGGTVVLNGTYEYYEAKQQHEVMNTTIERYTDAGTIPGGEEVAKGDGSEANPYNPKGAYDAAAALAADAISDQIVYVKGIISSIKYTFSAQFGTATFNISEDGTDSGTQFICYGVYYHAAEQMWVEGNDQVEVGKEVVVAGKLVNYGGKTPEIANKTGWLVSMGDAGTTPGGETTGDGTEANPYSASEAYAAAAALAADTVADQIVYVKGIISSIKYTFSAQYGTATFNISDDGKETSTQFTCYSVYYHAAEQMWVEGNDQVEVGKEVVVAGKLVNYGGNTPEIASKTGWLVSMGEPGTTPGGETPSDVDFTKAYTIKLTNENTWAEGTDATYKAGFETTVKGFKVGVYKHSATNNIVAPDQYSARVYKGAVISITAPEGKNIIGIRFKANDLNSGQYCKDLTEIEPGSSTLKADATTFVVGDWTGKATRVVFQSAEAQSRLVEAYVVLDGESGGEQPGPGDEPGPGETTLPENDGLSPETAFTVADAIYVARKQGSTASTTTYYVKGIVYKDIDFKNNATFEVMDGSTTDKFTIFRTKSFGGAAWTGDEPIGWGDEVVVKGNVVDLFGGMPALTNGTLVTWNGNTSFEEDEPGPVTGNDGLSLETAFTASEAREWVLANLASGANTGDTKYYVKGKVSKFVVSRGVEQTYTNCADYGNASFYVTNDGTDNDNWFEAYQVNYLEGNKWEEGNKDVAVGDEVVIYGPLARYNDIPETSGKGAAYLYSLNGATKVEGGETPGEEVITDSSVADFIAAASESTYYRLTGVVSEFKTGVSSKNWMQFNLTDETGSILVYGFKDGQYDEWAAKIKDGGTVVLNGTYTYYASKQQHEVMNATIESFTEAAEPPAPVADFTSVADLNGMASSTATEYTGTLTDAVVSFVPNANNAVIKDATGSILLYNKSGHGLKQGQTFSGETTVMLVLYNDASELTAIDAAFAGSETAVTPEAVTLSALAADFAKYQNAYVAVENLEVTAVDGKNITVKSGNDTYVVFSNAGNATCEVGSILKVTGTVCKYKGTAQIKAWTMDDIIVTQEVPGTVTGDFTSVADLNGMASSTATEYTGTLTDAVVSFVPNANNAVIKDATGSILLYKSGHGLKQGQTFSGETTVKLVLYNDASELTAIDAAFAGSETAVAPEAVTLSALAADFAKYQNAYVVVENLEVTAVEGKNITVKSGNDTYVVFSNAGNATCEVGAVLKVTGTVCKYKGTAQIKAWTMDDIVVTQEAPGDQPGDQPGDDPTGAGTYYVKVTSAPSAWAGEYLLVAESAKKALSEFSTTSTVYGVGADVDITDNGIKSTAAVDAYKIVIAPSVVAANVYTIKLGDQYLSWTSGNSLKGAEAESENAEWTITYDTASSSVYIVNAADATRKIRWNASSPRFACYTTAQTDVQLFKLAN